MKQKLITKAALNKLAKELGLKIINVAQVEYIVNNDIEMPHYCYDKKESVISAKYKFNYEFRRLTDNDLRWAVNLIWVYAIKKELYLKQSKEFKALAYAPKTTLQKAT